MQPIGGEERSEREDEEEGREVDSEGDIYILTVLFSICSFGNIPAQLQGFC